VWLPAPTGVEAQCVHVQPYSQPSFSQLEYPEQIPMVLSMKIKLSPRLALSPFLSLSLSLSPPFFESIPPVVVVWWPSIIISSSCSESVCSLTLHPFLCSQVHRGRSRQAVSHFRKPSPTAEAGNRGPLIAPKLLRVGALKDLQLSSNSSCLCARCSHSAIVLMDCRRIFKFSFRAISSGRA
jgi:hypothetical protein